MDPTEPETGYLQPLLGIVFDLDGTLVLSPHDFGRMRREVIRIAERYGVMPGHLHPSETIPRLMDLAHQELEATHAPEGQVYRMEVDVNAAVDAIELEALPKTVTRPGAATLLKTFTENGYRLGVLTRSSEHFCRAALERTGLAGFFPYLRTRSSPGPAKPSPEALRLLLEEMGVPRNRAAYVGDHPIDAECALHAQVRFYALLPDATEPDSELAEKFRKAGAVEVFSSLTTLGRRLGLPIPKIAPPPAH
jgi:phosphoglycolate phosphatase